MAKIISDYVMKFKNGTTILCISFLRRIRLMINFSLQRKPFMKCQQTLYKCIEVVENEPVKKSFLAEKNIKTGIKKQLLHAGDPDNRFNILMPEYKARALY